MFCFNINLCTRVLFALLTILVRRATATADARRTEAWPSESILESSSASPSVFTPLSPFSNKYSRSDSSEPVFTKNVFTMTVPSMFIFENKKGQFLKMPKWTPKQTIFRAIPSFGIPTMPTRTRRTISSVFSFEFRSSLRNGLLLYLDDGGPRDYIELSLRSGILQLSFKFGNARSVKVTVGKNLDDRRWHSVSMEVKGTQVSLSVDGKKAVATAGGPDASAISPQSFCYIGGIPSKYRLEDLSLPSVYFVSGFRGTIRRYAIDGKYQRPMGKAEVIEEVGSDLCYTERNPCKNNGTCIVLNNEPACDCSETRRSGKYCEGRSEVAKIYDVMMMSDQAYDEAAATFLGNQWFEYDMRGNGVSSYSDTITLYFKTKQSNGLLLHTGKSADFVNLSIKNGGIKLVVNLGSGAFVVLLKPTVGSFNDDKWHFLEVYRELKRPKTNGRREGASVTSPNTSSVMKSSPPFTSTSLFPILPSVCLSVNLTVDDAHTNAGFTQNDYTQLTLNDIFYVGGSPSTTNLPGSPETNNFIGCLKEVTYKNNDNTLQLSRMAKSRDSLITVKGGVEFRCTNIESYGPVTFRTSKSFLRLKPWNNPSEGGLKLDFRTTEPHGLLLYAAGGTSRDFIALELYHGFLYLLINLGSGLRKARHSYERPLNDGAWHSISLKRDRKQLMLNVDDENETRMVLSGGNTDLNVNSLFLGGADFEAISKSRNIPKGLWTASLRYGFVGCVRNVYMDGIGVDVYTLAKSKVRNPSEIAPECDNPGKSTCTSNPCRNGGKCREGWNRFVCDCSATSFNGPTCELIVQTVGFNGSQTLLFPMPSTRRTQAEEIYFRFKTPLSSGLLLTTTSKTTADRVTVKLVKGGQVKLTVDIDCVKKNCTAPRQGPDSLFRGSGLNDNKWHTVKISRHGRRVSLEVDGKIDGNELPVGHTELQFDAIHLGKVTEQVLPKLKSEVDPPFAGLIQNLMFNNEAFIERCFQQQTPCRFTGTWGETEIISNAVTFNDKDSFISTTTLDAYKSMTLFFNLKTTVSDGLILYNAGRDSDFIAVELVSGFIHYVYNLGNGAQIISTPDQQPINDNKWHSIRIVRDVSNTHTLSVDGTMVIHHGNDLRRNLDLKGFLFIGGVRNDLYYNGLPDRVASRKGFQGCLGTFDFNGVSPQLLKDRIISAGDVRSGCIGPKEPCTNTSCSNGGVCLQEWNSFTCDCSMTSHVGKTCTERGPSFRFNGGMIVYEWPSASFPSSRKDNLALGFATKERNCVIARISSMASSTIKDYMELGIENGRLTLRFNIGNKDVVLREPMSVVDGQYHRVVICRKWMNATMRVNSWPIRSVGQTGNARNRFALAATSIPPAVRPTVNQWLRGKERKNTVFNSQSMIQVGGLMMDSSLEPPSSRNSRSKRALKVVRAFRGQMSGFYFNDVSVFTLAAQGSNQVSIIGEVNLINEPPVVPTPPGNLPYPTTMATMTTFTTSSTRPVSMENASKGTECDGEEVCSGDSGNRSKDNVMIKDDKDTQMTPGVIIPPLITRSTGAASFESTRKSTPKLTTSETVESSFNDTKFNGSANLSNGDKKITNDNGSNVKTGFLGGILNGTTAMIAGIVGAAVICIVILLVAIYKYKHKDENHYHMDPNAPGAKVSNGHANGHAGSIVKKKNGSVKSNNKSSIRGKEVDKEYYV
uniref:neurexin-3a-like isoform X5 n=1 Tax=Styela clava TaxID=7725 RepID=UPI001939A440|nr:neurexin-3a-like isoform X5 [Styela clava]